MKTLVTSGIKVSVVTEYQPFYSEPQKFHFVFSYKVYIENQSNLTVKLLFRHWNIFDGAGLHYTVEGEGVVGVQPIIEPNHSHEYVSGCNFKGSIGKMSGFYLMEQVKNGKILRVNIPEFLMEVPYLQN